MAHSDLVVSPVGDRLWELAENCVISMHTDEGVLTMDIAKGYVTDFRSPRGVLGDIVDIFTPNTGTNAQACCYLFHDCCYTMDANGDHPVTRNVADELLYESLKYCGMSGLRAAVIWDTVRTLGEGPWEEPTEWGNGTRYNFEWDAK